MTSDLSRLRRELGVGHRVRVGQYLDSVREVERRIQRAEQSDSAALPDLERPVSVPSVWEDHVRLMFDLQVLALQADVTRVVTFQMARETSTRTYPHIGVPRTASSGLAPHEQSSRNSSSSQISTRNHVSLFAMAYVRFHGRNAATWNTRGGGAAQRFDYTYGEDELREWVEPLRELAGASEETYAFFNNNNQTDGVAQAPAGAALLAKLLEAEDVPVA